ncbi:unnamed protein product, partial [Larinioides sclopetarius]
QLPTVVARQLMNKQCFKSCIVLIWRKFYADYFALRETKCKVGFLPVNTVGKMVKTWQILLASVHLLEEGGKNNGKDFFIGQ